MNNNEPTGQPEAPGQEKHRLGDVTITYGLYLNLLELASYYSNLIQAIREYVDFHYIIDGSITSLTNDQVNQLLVTTLERQKKLDLVLSKVSKHITEPSDETASSINLLDLLMLSDTSRKKQGEDDAVADRKQAGRGG